MAMHASPHVAGHTPANNNKGWGFALFICALAVACWVGAWAIKNNTYLHPMDPRWQAIEPQSHEPAAGDHGAAAEHGAATEHGAPAAEHGAAPAPAGGGH